MKRFKTISLFGFVALWAGLLIHAQVSGPYGNIPLNTGNTATNTATLTVGQVAQTLLTATPTAAAVYTTPAASDWCNAFPFAAAQAAQGWNYDFYLKNTASSGSNAITWTAGTGVTILGTPTTSGGAMRVFRVVFQNCNVPAITVVPYGSNNF